MATSDQKKRPRGMAYGWKIAPSEYRALIDKVNEQLAREIEFLGYER
ncbi:MAG: hypothetical protein ACFFCW_16540 [Candidatus Hodarchaeota archaeon]